MKKNQGITLIALVITIIVLLILAGVAISMLSGENGILSRASEAKENTETAQKEEEEKLEDMELQTYLLSKSNYKYAYGYITGIEPGDTIESFENVLPDGYKVAKKYVYDGSSNTGEDKDIEESDEYLATGMTVVKDEKIVARIVIFGDINCKSSGGLESGDYSSLKRHTGITKEIKEEFRKLAMDINGDGIINGNDIKDFKAYLVGSRNIPINQNRYVSNPNKILFDRESFSRYVYVQKVWEDKKETDDYILEYDKDIDNYNFRLKTNPITVEALLNVLPSNGKIKRNGEVLAGSEVVQNGDGVVYSSEVEEVYIGKIIID